MVVNDVLKVFHRGLQYLADFLGATHLPVGMLHVPDNLATSELVFRLTGCHSLRGHRDALFSFAEDIERLCQVCVGVHVTGIGLSGAKILIFELEGGIPDQASLSFKSLRDGYSRCFSSQCGARFKGLADCLLQGKRCLRTTLRRNSSKNQEPDQNAEFRSSNPEYGFHNSPLGIRKGSYT